MLVRPAKLPISEASPFAADKLDRFQSAERLTLLLERVKPPFVLAIDAKYGNGKTTFIQMWRKYLTRKGFQSLYFNAWEADFTSDPLIAFIGEMDTEITRVLSTLKPSPKLRTSWKQVKKMGAYLAKRAIPVGVKIATAGSLDLDKFTEQSLATLAADIAKDQIEKYDTTKNRIKEFQVRLGEFIKSLNPSKTSPAFPLVFFVDELDRCRPPYAIELLERIKHFFGIEEIIFVLAVDKSQLFSSIRSVYGGDIDVDGYLRRFIDLEYRFPPPKTDNYNYYAYLASQFWIIDLLTKIGFQDASRMVDTIVRTFKGLADIFGLSLRVQEQCFATLSVILITAKLGSTHPPLLIALLALQAGDSNFYTAFLSGKKSVKDVLNFIRDFPNGSAFMAESEGSLFEVFLLTSRIHKDPSVKELIDSYKLQTSSPKTPTDPPSPAYIRAEYILSRLTHDAFQSDTVAQAARSIAFAEDFTAPMPPTGVRVS